MVMDAGSPGIQKQIVKSQSLKGMEGRYERALQQLARVIKVKDDRCFNRWDTFLVRAVTLDIHTQTLSSCRRRKQNRFQLGLTTNRQHREAGRAESAGLQSSQILPKNDPCKLL